MFGLGVEFVDQFMSVGAELRRPFGQFAGNHVQRLSEIERQRLLAQLAHQRAGLVDDDDLALGNDGDAVGHFLRFLDVMRRQQDGHAPFAQFADHVPHVAPQFDIDAGGGFVEKQDVGLVAQCLGDHDAPLHAARQFHDLRVALVPERQVAKQLFEIGVVARLAEQAAAESDRRKHAFEAVRGQFLRDEPDPAARLPPLVAVIAAVDQHLPSGRRHRAADDPDQRRLAGAIRTEKREDFALLDAQVDALQRLEAAGIGFLQVTDVDDGHAKAPFSRCRVACPQLSLGPGGPRSAPLLRRYERQGII